MKIELLLNRVSYENAVRTGELSFNGWFHGPASNDPDIEFASLPLLDLRKEDWGGLLVYGKTGQIFSADTRAFTLLLRLKNGETIDEIEKNPIPFTTSDIAAFRELLNKYAIEI